MKLLESFLKNCNKHSGKFWWKIIEHLIFIYILLSVAFILIPFIGFAFSIKRITIIAGHGLCLYSGLIKINFYWFVLVLIIVMLLYLPATSAWEIARKFGSHLYYHGKTKPRVRNRRYIKPRRIWRQSPPVIKPVENLDAE